MNQRRATLLSAPSRGTLRTLNYLDTMDGRGRISPKVDDKADRDLSHDALMRTLQASQTGLSGSGGGKVAALPAGSRLEIGMRDGRPYEVSLVPEN